MTGGTREDAAPPAAVLPADYHMHTAFSDGDGMPDDLVRRAETLGLPEIGICDHLVPVALDDGFGIPPQRLDEYVATVRAAAAGADIRVLLGLEADYSPETAAETAAQLTRWQPDYVIGSIHFVNGFAFDDPRLRDDPRQRDLESLWLRYFRLLGQAAGSGLFDVLGHVDLVKKFGRRPAMTPTLATAAREALSRAAENGVAIEINTSGWRQAAGEQYPSLTLLEQACRLGVPLTFGSDAHVPADVGSRFAAAVAVARSAGYSSWLRLSDRTEVPLA